MRRKGMSVDTEPMGADSKISALNRLCGPSLYRSVVGTDKNGIYVDGPRTSYSDGCQSGYVKKILPLPLPPPPSSFKKLKELYNGHLHRDYPDSSTLIFY